VPTTDAPSPTPWLESTLESRRRRRDAARGRKRRLRGRAAAGALAAAMTLASGVAVAHESPRERATQSASSAGGQSVRAGDRGPAVAAVQRRLGLSADGVFGPATRRAVKAFQRRRGLTADGIVGPRTAEALGVSVSATGGQARSLTGVSAGARAQLESIARCESGGDPRAVSQSGRYRGKYQFSRATWRSLGGTGDPAAAPEAEQDRRAAALLRQSGTAPWPNCA
jgi:hypothetical protein